MAMRRRREPLTDLAEAELTRLLHFSDLLSDVLAHAQPRHVVGHHP